MTALSIRNMNWSVGQREQLRDAAIPALGTFARLQIQLDVAHSALFNGIKYENPGMVARGTARVEEIRQAVLELVWQ
jgi:hypothetical protein